MQRTIGFCVIVAFASGAWAASPVELRIDASRPGQSIRALHGVNSGPLHLGETLDLSADHRELGIPLTRLHDCNWPTPHVVDIHAIFPRFDADASLPASYDFARTDDYLEAIVAAGSGIVFRLGESIEHSKRKYRVHPPADAAKWAAICLGIIRHYNEGWADGFHHKIRYWEIWNEPENRPAMWTGNDDDYYRLYATAAKAIKGEFPDVMVGGPAVGHAGQMQGDRLEPTPFVRGFLQRCRGDGLPLDFFSWHTYTNDPRELARRSHGVRRLLDDHGFSRTENHLNEWNYLPDNDWGPMLTQKPLERQAWFRRIHGAEGAAFTAAALMLLQDSPLDVSNFYSADIQGFGLFSEHGVRHKNFYALRAFRMLLDTPQRLPLQGQMPDGVVAMAGINAEKSAITVLIGNASSAEATLRLRVDRMAWQGESECEVRCVDDRRDLECVLARRLATDVAPTLDHAIGPHSVLVVTLRSGKPNGS
jgi:hypothetical protein